jgi:hypothetical protein
MNLDDDVKQMRKHIDDCIMSRAQHLEMFAAAFLQYVGSDKVLEYELIEESDVKNLRTRWFFRKIVS